MYSKGYHNYLSQLLLFVLAKNFEAKNALKLLCLNYDIGGLVSFWHHYKQQIWLATSWWVQTSDHGWNCCKGISLNKVKDVKSYSTEIFRLCRKDALKFFGRNFQIMGDIFLKRTDFKAAKSTDLFKLI